MHASRELQRSLQILKLDGEELFNKYSEQLSETEDFSPEHFTELWDDLRRELREVARSVYDEHWRYYRKLQELE